jgi:hypothetical protein
LPVTDLTADEAVFHALNRLAMGRARGCRANQTNRPGKVDRSTAESKFIEDKAVESRIEALPTLHLGTAKLIQEYL